MLLTRTLTRTVTVFMIVVIIHQDGQVSGYNINTKLARVMTGPNDSYYGYSVTLWQDQQGEKRVVVGAPRGRSSPEEVPRGSNATGSNYSLPLGNIHVCGPFTDHCHPLPSLPSLSYQDYSAPAVIWGDSIQSQGIGFGETLYAADHANSKLLACAPRYPRMSNSLFHVALQSRGACYLLDSMDSNPTKLLPYPDHSYYYENKTYRNGQSFTAYAMAGMSGIMSQDQLHVYLGGPLAFYAQGMLLRMESSGQGDLVTTKTYFDEEVLDDSYEGWAVVRGTFSGTAVEFLAASSTGYNNSFGKVSFYDALVLKEASTSLYGQEMGAQFGYCLGSADVDGDGVDDLLVGAPLARAGDKLLPDAGKIYLYYSPLVQDADKLPPSQVSGTDAWGRFGAAVTSLGDVDRDGYDDVAVAAPYAGSNRGGVVYIFNGGAGGLRTPHSQVIEASAFSEGLRGFGFSLDGGLDMDDNGYSDLIIGSAESNTAFFVRSSPVVRLVGGVYFTSETVMVDDTINCMIEKAGYQTIHGVCFDLTVNITYDTYKKFDNLEMQFKIVLEGPEDPSHFGFKINNDHRYITNRVVNFKGSNNPWSLQVFFKRVRSSIGQPLRASVTVSLLQQDADEGLSDAAATAPAPVLDTFSVSNTYVTNTTLVCLDNRTCFASPDLHLAASSHPFTLGENSVMVEVQLQVHHDPGYQVTVEVRHPEGLEFLRVEGEGNLPYHSDQKLVNQIANSFCVFDFIDADVIVNFTLVFEVRAVQVLDYLTTNNLTFLTLNLHVTSDTDTENNTLNNDATVIMPVTTKAILYTKAFSLLESTTVMVMETASSDDLQKAMKDSNSSFSVDKLGPHLLHEFSVTNRGPSPVRGAKLRFQLPLYRSDHLLTYYMGQPATTPHVTCTTITTNPYNLQPSSSLQPAVVRRSTVFPSAASTDTTFDDITSATSTTTTATSFNNITSATDVFFAINDTTTRWPDTLQVRRRRQVLLEEEAQTEVDELTTQSHASSPTPATTTLPGQGRMNRKTRLTKNLECNTAECILTCEVALLEAESTVTVSFASHLVTAAVTELPYRSVTVYSWMDVDVYQNNSTVINSRTSTKTRVFLLRPQERGLLDIPLSILLLAVTFSIFLVLLIIACLWKASFFKRHRPPAASGTKRTLSSVYYQDKTEEVEFDVKY